MAKENNILGQTAGSGSSIWGSITGNILDQTDLIDYLDLNFYPLNTNPAGYLTIADLPPVVTPTLQEVLTEGNTATDVAILMSNTSNDDTLAIESNALTFENPVSGDNASIATTAISLAGTNQSLVIDKEKIRRQIPSFHTDLKFIDPTANREIMFQDGDGTVAFLSDIISPSTILTTTITDGDTTHAPDGNSIFDALALKQDILISGTNIKTIEGQSLLGSGNIDLTKSDVGLSNVDNTSDINKPVSTAQQIAIDAKVSDSISDGVTTIAPSQNAVFDALILKENLSNKTDIISGNTSDSNKYLSTKGTYDYVNPIDVSLEEWRRLGWSAGAISGFAITNNGDGTANIASGVALLRTSVSASGVLNKYTLSAVTNQAFTDNTTNYIIADYNGGSPIITVTTNGTLINTLTTTLLYSVVRVGTSLYYQGTTEQNVDSNGKLRRRFLISERFAYGNGTIISATNRKLILTAGTFFTGLTPISTPAFNTNVSDTFTYVYYNGTNYTRTTSQTDIDNTTYINAGISTTMTNNKHRTDFVYLLIDNPTQLWVVQGDAQYNTIAEAKVAPTPTNLPPELAGLGIVVGRIIIEKSATTLDDVASPFTTSFTAGTSTVHNQLGGLQGGALNEYYHLNSTQYSYYDPTSSIQTQLNSRIKKIIVDTTNSSAVTGVITETLCKTYQILGGTFSASDFFKFMVSAEKTGGNAVFRISVKLNTTNNSATATQVATFITTNAGFIDVAIERVRLAFKGGNLRGLGFSTSVMTDITNSANAKGQMTLDPANDIWMYVFVTPSSASDSILISDVQVTN